MSSAEVQIFSSTCRTEAVRKAVLERMRQYRDKGCSILHVGKNNEGELLIVYALAGEATKAPAADIMGVWDFSDFHSQVLQTYRISSDIRIKQEF